MGWPGLRQRILHDRVVLLKFCVRILFANNTLAEDPRPGFAAGALTDDNG